jgi:hypothetical protein
MKNSTPAQLQHIPFDANVFQGRLETGLTYMDLDVVSASATRRFDPNSFVLAALEHTLVAGEPLYPSFLSGEPGFLYRNHVLQIALTGAELQRFACHALLPEEFFKLYRALGEFHEIHDDFYDPDTGKAYQPLRTQVPLRLVGAGERSVTVARGELLSEAERHDLIAEAKAGLPAELANVSPDALAKLLLLAEQAILAGQPSGDSLEVRRALALNDAVRDIFSPPRRSNGNVLVIEEMKERNLRTALDAALFGKPLPKWDPRMRELMRVIKAILRTKDRTSFGSRIVSEQLEQQLTAAFAAVNAP